MMIADQLQAQWLTHFGYNTIREIASVMEINIGIIINIFNGYHNFHRYYQLDKKLRMFNKNNFDNLLKT